jgi:hypothetical protein
MKLCTISILSKKPGIFLIAKSQETKRNIFDKKKYSFFLLIGLKFKFQNVLDFSLDEAIFIP